MILNGCAVCVGLVEQLEQREVDFLAAELLLVQGEEQLKREEDEDLVVMIEVGVLVEEAKVFERILSAGEGPEVLNYERGYGLANLLAVFS